MGLAMPSLVGCVSASVATLETPAEGSIKLRYTPDLACPAALGPRPLMFRIDESADEDVVAIGPDGTASEVRWSEGFVGGIANDPVVRDPDFRRARQPAEMA